MDFETLESGLMESVYSIVQVILEPCLLTFRVVVGFLICLLFVSQVFVFSSWVFLFCFLSSYPCYSKGVEP